MRFEFATAQRIVFGPGTINEAGRLAAGLGRRAIVATGVDTGRAAPLLQRLREAGVATIFFPSPCEPDLETIRRGAALGRREHCDLVASIGGGSVLDAGKAIAAMMTNEGDLLDYLEIIGRGQTPANRSAPFLAIPTTAGTGSEATRNAVLASPEHRVKVSLRSPFLLPSIALVDPELTRDLPPALTASTGLDALTQLIEPYVCARANPMTDAICEEGLRRAARSLRAAFANGARRFRPRGHGPGQPVRRDGAGQCRPGRGSWVGRADWRHVSGPPRGGLRRLAAGCHAGEFARSSPSSTQQPGPVALPIRGPASHRPAPGRSG